MQIDHRIRDVLSSISSSGPIHEDGGVPDSFLPKTLHYAPRGAYLFQTHLRGGGGLIETGSLFERGGGLFNLEDNKTVVSALHKELEYQLEKLKYKKLEVMQPRIKSKSHLPAGG